VLLWFEQPVSRAITDVSRHIGARAKNLAVG
jgi:hypothetical protein